MRAKVKEINSIFLGNIGPPCTALVLVFLLFFAGEAAINCRVISSFCEQNFLRWKYEMGTFRPNFCV